MNAEPPIITVIDAFNQINNETIYEPKKQPSYLSNLNKSANFLLFILSLAFILVITASILVGIGAFSNKKMDIHLILFFVSTVFFK